MKTIFAILFLFLGHLAIGQYTENVDSAFYRARSEQIPVLLVFSGSDWCAPCIRFHKDILTNETFIKFADEKLVVLKADFPQRRAMMDEQIRQNEELAEQFNPGGAFPYIVLLDKDREMIATLRYTRQMADEFIGQLETVIPANPLKEYKLRVTAMGSFFEFIIVLPQDDETNAQRLMDLCVAEVNRIEQLISEWIPDSEVGQINTKAGKEAVAVSDEVYQLIERSIETGNLTQGAFDITFHALDGLWQFDGSQTQPPDSTLIIAALSKVGYQKIQLLPDNKVFLSEVGMSIGFGGIGQGYAVDKIKELLIAEGVGNFIINSSGDIYARGIKADGTPWKIGVADPFDKTRIIRWLDVINQALVTSGNYEKYFEYDGVRYAHIIDPKTGWPTNGVMSVTVISPYAEIADALATSIFVLGKEVGINLIDQLPNTHCIVIDDKKNVFYSAELKD